MKLTVEQFVTVVRALPLSAAQLAAAEAAFAASAPSGLPNELICREVLTEFQARQILAGRGADLTVGRYLLLSELGAGGMGTVFKARDTAMDRVVALKLIRDERLANPAALARFQQEVRAAARLAHPNIVRAYDAGTANGRHFLVTELVAGHDLGHELARRGALPPGEACEFARQAAVGLQHAHEQGLTHRDIKPSNLLFSTAEKLVKVADFGLARVSDAGANGLTADGSVMGTPDYIAPEQASSATAADTRSDLYSLGCTLYHFLTGRVPFPADSAYAKLLAHTRDEPEPLDEACPGLNPALVAVVQKLMAKNPADRYQTPLEAADALIPFCPKPRTGTTSVVSRPVTAPPVPVAPSKASASNPVVLPTPSTQNNSGRRTVPPPLPVIPDAFAVPDPQPAPKSNKALALAGVGGGVLALAVLMVVLTRGGGNTNTNDVKVTVPVSVSVKLDDWAKAREPGVILVLGDRTMALADFAKVELPPGHHVIVAKKDGKGVEARAFDVKEGDAGKAVAARVVGVPDPDGRAEEIRRWGATSAVIDLTFSHEGACFTAVECDDLPQTSKTESTSLRRYSADSNKVLNTWTGSGGYRSAVLWSSELAFDCPRGDAPRHEGFFFRSLDFRNGAGTIDQSKAVGIWYTQRMHILRASNDERRALWSWSTKPMGAAVDVPYLPSGQVMVVQVSVGATRIITTTESSRFPGTSACFDPTGERVLLGLNKTLRLWDEKTGKPVREYTGAKADVECVAMAENGSRLAAGDQNGTVYAWKADANDPTAVCTGHKGKVNAVGVSNDGARVVSAGEDGTVRVWDATNGQELHQYKHDGPVYALAMSPGGKRVLTGGADNTIRLWQLPP